MLFWTFTVTLAAQEIDSVPYNKIYTPESYAAIWRGLGNYGMGNNPPKYEIDIVRK